jgi:hypothetical protein
MDARRCESNYVYSFDIYTGKNKSKREEGATAAVVLKLIEPLTEHCWHRIGMDGFFTSVELFEKLLSKGFYAVGTTRHNRKHFPKELLKEVETCARGEYVWRQHGSMVCFSWMDKKPVNLLSTFNDPLEKSTIKRRTGKDLFDVSCPSVVPDYLRTMRGVDVFAQRQSYSKIGRRSKKWFYSLVWFMFDVAIHNAFILHQKKHKQQHYSEKDFRKQLMDQLVHGFTSRKIYIWKYFHLSQRMYGLRNGNVMHPYLRSHGVVQIPYATFDICQGLACATIPASRLLPLPAVQWSIGQPTVSVAHRQSHDVM